MVETVWACLDQSKENVTIFLDLAMASNSISHNIFFRKIETYVFSQGLKEDKRINVFISFQPQTNGKY